MAAIPRLKIPAPFRRGHALLVSDEVVSLARVRGGGVERLAVFSNDETGVTRFVEFLRSGKFQARGKTFRVLANVIGEDYRFERVAHLVGKYRLDFHKRQMEKLFRGSPYCLSETHGREERGRREDQVLFFGILTEDKIAPWVAELYREGGVVAGVFNMAMASPPLIRAVADDLSGNCLLVTLHEQGLMRQTMFRDGKLRFSRVSKVNAADARAAADSLKREMERTVQYMNSQKVPMADGVSIHFVCPSGMVSQLREIVPSGERIRARFHDAAAVARRMGATSALEEMGRDSTLHLHALLSEVHVFQMAPFNVVRFYWARTAVATACTLVAVYGAYNLAVAGGDAASGYFEYAVKNVELEQRARKLENDYKAEVATIGDPPSTAENMRAVSRAFKALSEVEVSPSPLMFYFSEAFAKNSGVRVDKMRWWVANNRESGAPSDDPALFDGGDVYQILEVSGVFEPRPNETYLDVAERAEKLMASFSQRQDIAAVGLVLPSRELSAERLQGTLDDEFKVDAPETRDFTIRLVWHQYNEEALSKLMGEDLNI